MAGVKHDQTRAYEFCWEKEKDGSGIVSYRPNGENALCYSFRNESEEKELEQLCQSLIATFDFSFDVSGDIEDARDLVTKSFRRKMLQMKKKGGDK